MNFIPSAVITNSGKVPFNAAKQSSPRAVASISTARPVNIAAPKPKVNDALHKTYSYFKAHSPIIKKLMVVLLLLEEVLKEELKFNLFSVSQMCDKKNSVLFTETECLVLSPDFKLLDESQVLLKIPKQNNMYSFDLKNVVPSGGETLLENRVLVTKPPNKTTYELLIGRPLNLDFMRPFGCPVTILNTLDNLGKFEGKADEGFLVGYSINSKAFWVFNTRTRKVEENLHIKFLGNKSNVAGSGPEWLFDIDSLTKSMNYKPVTTGNQTNGDAGIETNVNVGQTRHEKASNHEYILLPFFTSDSQGPKSSDDEFVDDAGKKNDAQYPVKDGDKNSYEKDVRDKEEANSTNRLSTVSLFVSAARQ
ncbi:retrovirus-related pol polyprotein from transposon TNT 1-94, partial [Tanacetum coccineum]